jgi:hypothetical protein
MRRNASTVVVLPGPAPAEVIQAARTFYPGHLAGGTAVIG